MRHLFFFLKWVSCHVLYYCTYSPATYCVLLYVFSYHVLSWSRDTRTWSENKPKPKYSIRYRKLMYVLRFLLNMHNSTKLMFMSLGTSLVHKFRPFLTFRVIWQLYLLWKIIFNKSVKIVGYWYPSTIPLHFTLWSKTGRKASLFNPTSVWSV